MNGFLSGLAAAMLLMPSMLAGAAPASGDTALQSETARINYSVGFQVGTDFRRQGVGSDPEAMARGMRDAVEGHAPLMTDQEMTETLQKLKRRIVADQRAEQRRKSDEYRAEGRDFLGANAKKPGVVVLPSGLQYQILRKADGRSPGRDDAVTVNYIGRTLDGTEFDSSYRQGKPATFQVNGVIPGWTEALQLMKEGEKWRLYIPPELAYGERGPLADRTLIFEVELLKVGGASSQGGAQP
ncbi:MAG: FKBP-type peptidyl-prolyl cis-trans isomerase [Gammaproteobacteria bacterium]|jgi:FKBP-type peptidyl-prolyl cis-trans isomerase FklB